MDKSKLGVVYEISPELLHRHLNDCKLLSGEKIYGMSHEIAVDFHGQLLGKFIDNKKYRIVAIDDGKNILGLAIIRHKKTDSEILETRIASIEWLSVIDNIPQNIRMDVSLILVKTISDKLSEEFELVTSLIDVDNMDLLWALQQNGYRIYATNTTHTLNLRKVSKFQIPDTLLVRLMRPSEVALVMDSALAAFADYRSHYHFDPKLFLKSCTETYIKFVQQSIEMGDPVALALSGDCPDTIYGFLTFGWHHEVNGFFGGNKIGEIEIGGVVPGGRGRGVYEAMMKFGINWYSDNGAHILVVNCNVGNMATQRCWSKLGFSLRRYQHRLHKWFV